MCVCVCVVSFVTLRSRDAATVQQPYGYMWYIGFVIHISGRNVQSGGESSSGFGLVGDFGVIV